MLFVQECYFCFYLEPRTRYCIVCNVLLFGVQCVELREIWSLFLSIREIKVKKHKSPENNNFFSLYFSSHTVFMRVVQLLLSHIHTNEHHVRFFWFACLLCPRTAFRAHHFLCSYSLSLSILRSTVPIRIYSRIHQKCKGAWISTVWTSYLKKKPNRLMIDESLYG